MSLQQKPKHIVKNDQSIDPFNNYNQSQNQLDQMQYQQAQKIDQEYSQDKQSYFYPLVQAKLIANQYDINCLLQMSIQVTESQKQDTQNNSTCYGLLKQLDQLKKLQKRIQQLSINATEKQSQNQNNLIPNQKEMKQKNRQQLNVRGESDIQRKTKQLEKMLNLIFQKATNNNKSISTIGQYRTIIFVALQGLFKILNFRKTLPKQKDEEPFIQKYEEEVNVDIDQYLYLNSDVEDKANRYSFGSKNKLQNVPQQNIKDSQIDSDQAKVIKILDILLEQNNRLKSVYYKDSNFLSQGKENEHKQKVIVDAFSDIFQESLQKIYLKVIQFQKKIAQQLQKRNQYLKNLQTQKQQQKLQKNQDLATNLKILQFVRQTRIIFELAYNNYFQKSSSHQLDRLIFGDKNQQSCIFNQIISILITFSTNIQKQLKDQTQSSHKPQLNLQNKFQMIDTFLRMEINRILALHQNHSMSQIFHVQKQNQKQLQNYNQTLLAIQIKSFIYQTLKNQIIKDSLKMNENSFVNRIMTKNFEINKSRAQDVSQLEINQHQALISSHLMIKLNKLKQMLQTHKNVYSYASFPIFLNEFQNILSHLLYLTTKQLKPKQKQLQRNYFQFFKSIILSELVKSSDNYHYHYFLLQVLFLTHQKLRQENDAINQQSKIYNANKSKPLQQKQQFQWQQCISLKEFILYEQIFMKLLSQIHLIQTQIKNNQSSNSLLSIIRSKMYLHQNRTPLIQNFLFQKNIMQTLAFHYSYKEFKIESSTINYISNKLNQKKLELQLQVSLNSNKQNSYIKQQFSINPFKTSTWMLKHLLQKSSIKTQRILKQNKVQTKRGFSSHKQQEMNFTYQPIDPMHFLMINYKILSRLEIELGTLALWILTQVWMQNFDYIMKKRNFNNNENKTPPSIFGQRVMYKIINSSNINNPQKLQKLNFAQIEKYKRSLMTTLMVHLLTLKYPTKMLQYYPIQNQLLKELLQLDFFCDLIMKNQYIFENFNQNKSSNKNKKSQNDQRKTKEQILQKIKKAQNIEQLQKLCLQLQKKENQETEIKKQTFQLFPDEFPLPWMTLITSPKFLQNFISIPQGYFIIQKIAEKRPQTFQKKYSDVYIWRISNFIGGIISKIQNKQYCRRGNLKSLLKKQKNVQEETTQTQISMAEIQHQKQLLHYIKKLLQIYSKFGGQKSKIYSKQMLQKLGQIEQFF